MGGDLSEYENELRDLITKKFNESKKSFTNVIRVLFLHNTQNKCEALLENMLLEIEDKIKRNMYTKMIDFIQDLQKLKNSYDKNCSDYDQRALLFAENTERVIIKAADYIISNSENTVQSNIRY